MHRGRQMIQRWLCHRLCAHRSVQLRHNDPTNQQAQPSEDVGKAPDVLTSNLLAEIRVSVCFKEFSSDGRQQQARCFGRFHTHESEALSALIRKHGSTVQLYASAQDVAWNAELPFLVGLLTGVRAENGEPSTPISLSPARRAFMSRSRWFG